MNWRDVEKMRGMAESSTMPMPHDVLALCDALLAARPVIEAAESAKQRWPDEPESYVDPPGRLLAAVDAYAADERRVTP